MNRNTPPTPDHRKRRVFPLSGAGRSGLFATSLFLCLLASCNLPGPSQHPAKQFYLLHLDKPIPGIAAAAVPRACLTLRITTPQSAPGFSTARMAYIMDPPRIDYFAYHEWVDTPAKLLASAIEKRLDDSGLFAAVMSASTDVRADYRLDTELQRLVQVFDAGGSRLELSVKVSLVDIANRSLLNARSFTYAETADRANPEGGVSAANRATGRFLDDLLAALTASFSSVECPSPR